VIFTAFFRALGQLGDRRFRRVLLLGALLALALLFAIYAGFLQLVWWLTIGLSVFLMVPVASAFTGLFLEDVVDAVEDRHYPGLAPARTQPPVEALLQSVNFLGLVIAVNVGASSSTRLPDRPFRLCSGGSTGSFWGGNTSRWSPSAGCRNLRWPTCAAATVAVSGWPGR
jgi:uncharacterized protein involved in cysteine biosynthesis